MAADTHAARQTLCLLPGSAGIGLTVVLCIAIAIPFLMESPVLGLHRLLA